MNNDEPIGLILFFNDFEYVQAASYCADFDIDVSEVYNLVGFPCLIFYDRNELGATLFFCKLSEYHCVTFEKTDWNSKLSIMLNNDSIKSLVMPGFILFWYGHQCVGLGSQEVVIPCIMWHVDVQTIQILLQWFLWLCLHTQQSQRKKEGSKRFRKVHVHVAW